MVSSHADYRFGNRSWSKWGPLSRTACPRIPPMFLPWTRGRYSSNSTENAWKASQEKFWLTSG
uniref:Uncharacterized protein n=1 Tax=Rhizophora mucronata TaxID=61149 RepID=A0A2P2QC35_RHIMU